MECRGTDLRQATAEEAAYELAKPADKVTILALFNIDREYEEQNVFCYRKEMPYTYLFFS